MTRREQVAQGLLTLSAAGALVSLAAAIPVVRGAEDATVVPAWHDLPGFPVYAGLLAWRPRGYPGVWELLVVQKAATTLIAARLAPTSADDTALPAWSDGILTLVRLVAYVTARGDRAWSRTSQSS